MVTKETQSSQLLKLLRAKDDDGNYKWVTSNQMWCVSFRFGARLFELRLQGYEIEKRLTPSGWQYRYTGNLDRELEYAD